MNHSYEQVSYDSIKNILPVLPPLTNKLFVKADNPSKALYEATQLLPLLSEHRASDKESWSTIGRILYTLSNEDGSVLNVSSTFLKDSSCLLC